MQDTYVRHRRLAGRVIVIAALFFASTALSCAVGMQKPSAYPDSESPMTDASAKPQQPRQQDPLNGAGLSLKKREAVTADINERWTAIQEAMVEAELDTNMRSDAATAMAERVAGKPVAEARAICTPPDPPKLLCKDVCKLANSICDNAENICRLAEQLDEDWARGRCTGATTSCGQAADRCCGCR